ncbi:putative Cyclochlorotine biosynthesis protein O [Seiridium cardinale]|uniref:Cyclochlorotine biosynthesis protein O n=1 Tax=Seiridium cardinale TaxID=138064 RepID=A0ABR2XDW1_9PEZI
MGITDVKQHEPEAQSFLGGDSLQRQARKQSPRWEALTTVALAAFVFSYALMAAYIMRGLRTGSHVLGNEGVYDDAPIVYEKLRFKRAGFHDGNHQATTQFEGRPDVANNAAWDELISVGVVTISQAENDRLSRPSASMRGDASEHIVEIAMFHQLHCLKWLRQEFWAQEDAIETGRPRPVMAQRQEHFDHCIDYLRQVIMCHGDITPITFEWNTELNTYLAHHSTEHVCRNFEALFHWAHSRAAEDFDVDGNHENVELQDPEMFD